ncbi:hypothetical protein RW03080701_061 [Synechococcus phage S-RIM8]|uniref:Uncharacterized protein n=1 Tax=Synechococcus phage S-RIM8 TaxID=756278 RepID=A0A1D7S9W6_9CAUD|nr:hypothetical protein RW03080701_061 [Synechococcus phage S-RIM8]
MTDLTHEEMLETAQQREAANEHPEIAEVEWIDDTFHVYKTRYGVYHSAAKDGEELVTALTAEQCVAGTRFYLKGRQEGWNTETSRVMNDGKVGGKL